TSEIMVMVAVPRTGTPPAPSSTESMVSSTWRSGPGASHEAATHVVTSAKTRRGGRRTGERMAPRNARPLPRPSRRPRAGGRRRPRAPAPPVSPPRRTGVVTPCAARCTRRDSGPPRPPRSLLPHVRGTDGYLVVAFQVGEPHERRGDG